MKMILGATVLAVAVYAAARWVVGAPGMAEPVTWFVPSGGGM